MPILQVGKLSAAFFAPQPIRFLSGTMQPENNDIIHMELHLFHQGKEVGLNYVFKELYPLATNFAYQYLKNKALAEELAVDAFLKLWKMHHKLDSLPAIRSYLFKIIFRDCNRANTKEKKRATINIEEAIIFAGQNQLERLTKAETYYQLHKALD